MSAPTPSSETCPVCAVCQQEVCPRISLRENGNYAMRSAACYRAGFERVSSALTAAQAERDEWAGKAGALASEVQALRAKLPLGYEVELAAAQAEVERVKEQAEYLDEQRQSAWAEVERLTRERDGAYSERNQCVALLVKMAVALGWRAGVGQHIDKPGEAWESDWRTLVSIDLPSGQVSWHFHDSEKHLLDGLAVYPAEWDGHDTPEKYRRVNACAPASLAARVKVLEEAGRRILPLLAIPHASVWQHASATQEHAHGTVALRAALLPAPTPQDDPAAWCPRHECPREQCGGYQHTSPPRSAQAPAPAPMGSEGAAASDRAAVCDKCKKAARRPWFRPCPAGWLYLEAKDNENPDATLIVWACSRECAAALWMAGPGERLDAAPSRGEGTPEAECGDCADPAGGPCLKHDAPPQPPAGQPKEKP